MTSGGIPFLEQGIECVCVDSADPSALAAWWQRLLGGEARVDSDGDVALRTAGVQLLFLAVLESKRGKNRLHLDLRATNFESAVEAALALGAQRADDVYDGPRWQVLRDPEGNEFCILRPRQDGEPGLSEGDSPSPSQP
jgi:catechol 2,3-dioxygenase-like lactoylglutathione lyase family enzyme